MSTVFTPLLIYRVKSDGQIERTTSETPAIVRSEPIRVSIRTDTDQALAARLLRKLADEIEAQR